MKYKHLLLIMLFFPALAVHGQVTQFGVHADQNSILRCCELPDGRVLDLILVQEDPATSCFVLHLDGDTTAQRFYLLTSWTVRDVRIWDGRYAYFCGIQTDPFTNDEKGLVGMFDIMAFLGGTGVVNYYYFDWVNYGFIIAKDLKRLDLFEITGGVGMAMVGDAIFNKANHENTTTVAYADFDGTTWRTCTFMRKPTSLKFTDIVCLKDLIVAVGTDTLGAGCYTKTFYRGSCFPSMPCTGSQYQQLVYGSPVGNVLAAQTQDDTAVLAHYDNTAGGSTVLHKVSFSYLTGLFDTPVDTWESAPAAPAYGSGWQLRELTANGNHVHLLHYTAYPGASVTTDSWWVMGGTLPYTSAPITANLWYPTYNRVQSLDKDPLLNKPRISVNNLDLLTYGIASWNEGPCCIVGSVTLNHGTGFKDLLLMDCYSWSDDPANFVFIPVLTTISATEICR